MKRDFCGEEYIRYDLEPVIGYRRTRYICYKCRRQGDEELRKSKIRLLEQQKKIGEK